MRSPSTDTLQKIAAALDVTTSYLLEEDEDVKLPLREALASQSLKLFLRWNVTSPEERSYAEAIRRRESAPDSIKGWKNLLQNLQIYARDFYAPAVPPPGSLS